MSEFKWFKEVVVANPEKLKVLKKFCIDTFGIDSARWFNYGYTFFFSCDRDKTLFLLAMDGL